MTAPAPAEEATEQVLNPTGTSDASQGAFAPPPIVPPSSAVCTPAEKELPADESLTSLAVYFRNWHMFREHMNNISR